MRTIHSLTYTNMALTVLILLVLGLMVKPYFKAPAAYALEDRMEERRGSEQSERVASMNPNADNAAALREIAAGAREIAAAIREGAKAQTGVANALSKLGQPVQ